MTYVYEAEITYDDEDACWYVSIPVFPGAFSSAKDVSGAAVAASELLTLFVAEYADEGRALPEPTFHKPPLSVVCVEVTPDVVEETKYLTVSQAAEELEVTPGRVCQLIGSGVLEAREFHGRRMVSIASVNERKANRRGAGRPRREHANV